MELIYTDTNLNDIGILQGFTLDLAFGKDENDFQLTTTTDNAVLEPGNYIYIDGTEYGGIVDGIKVDTSKGTVIYAGRTWQGILNSKVIEPPTGQAYRTVSGDANTVLGSLITLLGLGSLFSASVATSEFTISNYSFDRYVKGYDGITKMLKSVGARLELTFHSGAVLSAVAIKDYTTDEEFDSSQVDMVIEKVQNPVNHIICLGSGELQNRQVAHLYLGQDGLVTETQYYTGLNEVSDIYDYPNAESLDELKKGGAEKLTGASSSIRLNLDGSTYAVGDIVGGYENITKTQVKQTITKKIVTIQNGYLSVKYEVGE